MHGKVHFDSNFCIYFTINCFHFIFDSYYYSLDGVFIYKTGEKYIFGTKYEKFKLKKAQKFI